MPGDSSYIMLYYFYYVRKKRNSQSSKPSVDSDATTVVS